MKREHQHKVLFDDEEQAQLLALSQAAGLKPATYLRQAALGKPVMTLPPDLKLLLAEIGRERNNLNQIARNLNAGFALDGVDARSLKTECDRANQRMAAVAEQIRRLWECS